MLRKTDEIHDKGEKFYVLCSLRETCGTLLAALLQFFQVTVVVGADGLRFLAVFGTVSWFWPYNDEESEI